MDCYNCDYFEIKKFVYKDETRSADCNLYNKLIGFVNNDGIFVEKREISDCTGLNVELMIKPKINSVSKKSGVKGIVWNKHSKCWYIKHYPKVNGRCIQYHVGRAKELKVAKQMLENFLDKYEKGLIKIDGDNV